MELARQIMAGIIFAIGIATIALGLTMIMTREYQEALRTLASHSTRLSGRAITEEGLSAILEAMSRLLDAIRKLVATAVGVGAFLCLLGLGMAALGYWMIGGG